MPDVSALPRRAGARPRTTASIPHSQTDQQPADASFLDAVLAEAASWAGVVAGPSGISVEGARALVLTDGVPTGPAEAFFVGREFAHGHARGDHSLHLTLPRAVVDEAENAGWTEPHFLALEGRLPRTHVMLYAPRDDDEVAVALRLLHTSYQFATGALAAAS